MMVLQYNSVRKPLPTIGNCDNLINSEMFEAGILNYQFWCKVLQAPPLILLCDESRSKTSSPVTVVGNPQGKLCLV